MGIFISLPEKIPGWMKLSCRIRPIRITIGISGFVQSATPAMPPRILDSNKRIIEIVNNYSRISFNFGPTLLSWLEKRA